MEQYHYNNAQQQPTWKFKARLQHCQIWQHSQFHTIAQAYSVQNYQRTHAKINRNRPYLVNSLGAVVDHRNQKTYLLIQRIPNRLSEVMILNQSQALKVLHSVFRGLQELQEIYGLIVLTQGCICFNETGKVKIWVNPDLSSLHPIINPKEIGQTKITQIIGLILNMIEQKCFNTSFLKNFLKKLTEHKIISYRQAAQQILKIGQLLFIDVLEKSQKNLNLTQQIPNKIPNRSQNRNQTTHISQQPAPLQKHQYSNVPQRDYSYQAYQSNCGDPVNRISQVCNYNGHGTNKHLKTEDETFKTTRKQGHSRKFSNHDHQANHRRVQSFLESQNSANKKQQPMNRDNLGLNLNKFTQSQAFQIDRTGIHKSAPLSPRQNVVQGTSPQSKFSQTLNFTKKNNCIYSDSKKQISETKNKQNYKNHLNFPKKLEYRTLMCPTIKEDNSQIDDSFSHNLKVDDKQIMVSGQFQTFGILQDLNQKPENSLSMENKIKKKSNNQKMPDHHQVSNKRSEFNIQDMDLQIQKKLEKKNKQGKQGKRVSILRQNTSLNQLHQNQIKKVAKQQLNHKNQIIPSSQFMDQEKGKTTKPNHNFCLPLKDQNLHNVTANSNRVETIRRQKSPSVAYIDQKYQQYVHSKNQHNQPLINEFQYWSRQKQQIDPFSAFPKIPNKHCKHSSNFENISGMHSKISLHSTHGALNFGQMTARNFRPEYRIPTER